MRHYQLADLGLARQFEHPLTRLGADAVLPVQVAVAEHGHVGELANAPGAPVRVAAAEACACDSMPRLCCLSTPCAARTAERTARVWLPVSQRKYSYCIARRRARTSDGSAGRGSTSRKSLRLRVPNGHMETRRATLAPNCGVSGTTSSNSDGTVGRRIAGRGPARVDGRASLELPSEYVERGSSPIA